MGLEKIFVALLAKEIFNKEIDEEAIKNQLNNIELVKALYALSKMHDLAHIICLALKHIGVWGKEEVFDKFLDAQSMAVYRYEQQKYEYEKVCCAFEEAKIPYMPLKGVCMKHLYPEEWMRTSSDIDILVKQEDVKAAEKLMTEKCGYKNVGHYRTEASFHNEGGACVEIHFLSSEYITIEIPLDVWEKAHRVENSCKHIMPEEMFYYHTVSHLAKHLCANGCGIKPFLDLYILDKEFDFDKHKAQELLKQYNLDKAEKAMLKTAKVWFDAEESDKLTEIMRKRVLLSGSYGNKTTSSRTIHKNRGGKIRYILWLFLPDRTEMERRYPILKQHPNKLVLYHFKRWGHLIFGGRIKSSAKIIGENMAIPTQEVDNLKFMLNQMGLE